MKTDETDNVQGGNKTHLTVDDSQSYFSAAASFLLSPLSSSSHIPEPPQQTIPKTPSIQSAQEDFNRKTEDMQTDFYAQLAELSQKTELELKIKDEEITSLRIQLASERAARGVLDEKYNLLITQLSEDKEKQKILTLEARLQMSAQREERARDDAEQLKQQHVREITELTQQKDQLAGFLAKSVAEKADADAAIKEQAQRTLTKAKQDAQAMGF